MKKDQTLSPERSSLKRQNSLSLIMTRKQIFRDLEVIYTAAFIAKNYSVALRIIELRGKEVGLFNEKKKECRKLLTEMTEDELLSLLKS